MKSKLKIIVAVIVVGGIIFGARSVMLNAKAKIANEALPQASFMNVVLAQPQEGTLAKTQHFLAQLEANKNIKLATKIPGYIQKIYVVEAQKVKKGDILVKIDEKELIASITSLRSTLAMQEADAKVAEQIYKRNKKLYDVGGLPLEKLELSKVAYEAKKAQAQTTKQKIAQLQNQRSYLSIKAPFDGVIDTIFMHQGDLAVSAKPIISMNDQKQKLLFSYATPSIKKSQEVFYNGKIVGKIRAIYPTSQNALLRAEVALDKTIDKPIGTFVDIEVVIQKQQGCIVPFDTILHKKEGDFVLIYHDKKFIPHKVNVLFENEENILLQECPNSKIARGSETKLAQLPAFSNVTVIGK